MFAIDEVEKTEVFKCRFGEYVICIYFTNDIFNRVEFPFSKSYSRKEWEALREIESTIVYIEKEKKIIKAEPLDSNRQNFKDEIIDYLNKAFENMISRAKSPDYIKWCKRIKDNLILELSK
jgi:hypothetical protein